MYTFISELDRELKALTADGVRGRQLVEKTADVLLGTTTVPLVTLLSHRTGPGSLFLPCHVDCSRVAYL